MKNLKTFIYDERVHKGNIHAIRSAGFICHMQYYPEVGYARAVVCKRTNISEILLKFGIYLNPRIGEFYSPPNRMNFKQARYFAPLRAFAKFYTHEHPLYLYIDAKGNDSIEAFPDQPIKPNRRFTYFIPEIKAVYTND